MKLFAPLFAYAVSAFPSNVEHGRSLLSSTTPLIERGHGSADAHIEGVVSRSDLIAAAQAADMIYNTASCKNADGSLRKYGDWTCVNGEEVTYKFWFDDNAAKIRFHFLKGPDNKCGFVFRGTENDQAAEWWTNLNFVTKEPSWWYMGERIHKGYKDAFDGWQETYWEKNDLGLPVSKTRQKGGEIKGKFTWYLNHYKEDCVGGVHFIGHSLGGALATVADIWYAQIYGIDKKAEGYQPDAVSITFGAPMIIEAKDNNKRPANELRIIHEFDPVSSSMFRFMTADEYGKGMEHRGPARVIKCKSNEWSWETCSKIVFEKGTDQTFSATGKPAYHSMYNYLKYVSAEVEPLKLKNTDCTKHAQCHTGYCSCSWKSCQADTSMWAWTDRFCSMD